MRKAIIDKETNLVENVIEIEDGVEWELPEGKYTIAYDKANIGDTYNPKTEEFIAPPEEVKPSPPPILKINDLAMLLVSKGVLTPQEIEGAKR